MATSEEPAGQETGSPSARTSGLAIASLVLSCLSLPLFCGAPLLAIPGIICGHAARRECEGDPAVGGDGLAVAGLVVGYAGLGLAALVVLFYIFGQGGGGGG